MKQTLTLLIVAFAMFTVNAQTNSASNQNGPLRFNNPNPQITTIQYFFNTDPGVGVVGNGGIVSVLPVDTLNQTINIPVAGLPMGINNLYIRVMDGNNVWSIAERRLFFIDNNFTASNIIAYQYYFDTDPGVGIAGNGAVNSITPTQNYTDILNINIPNTLSNGIHNLYIRVQDDNHRWSIAERRLFFIDNFSASNIIAYQYYFDNDPGVNIAGNGAIVPISPTSNYNAVINLPLSGSLSSGIHNLYIRTKDEQGRWSIAERRLFYIDNAISVDVVALEYFFDNDPGVNNGTPIPLTPSPGVNQSFAMILPALPAGAHQLYVRAKDSQGRWSIFERGAVTALPGIAASVITAAGSTTICSGDSLLLYTSGTTGVTYQWMDYNTGIIAGATNDSLYVHQQGNYALIATTTVSDTSNAILVSILPTVTPSISLLSSQLSFCQGTEITITANATNGGVSPTFDFKIDGVSIQNSSSNQFVNSNLLSLQTVSCVMSANNQCQTSATASANAGPFVIFENPDIKITASDTSICQGQSITLSASDLNDIVRSTSITWSDGVINGTAFFPTSTHTYTVSATNSNSCTKTDTFTVFVNPIPLVTSAASITICNGANVNLSLNASTPSAFKWIANDNANITGESITLQTASAINDVLVNQTNLNQVVNYTVTPISTSGSCYGSNQPFDVTVLTTLLADAGANQTVCDSANTILTGLATGANGPFSYYWNNGLSNFTAQTYTINPESSTTYTLTVTDAKNCSASAQMSIIVHSSTDIYGHVTFSSGNIQSGSAVLYHWVPPYTLYDRVRTVLINSNGYYHFPNVVANDYLVKVFPNISTYPTLIKTYYGNTYMWDSATVIHHSCISLDTFDISVQNVANVGGTGFLSGYVYADSSYFRSIESDPVPGIDVKVGRNPSGALAATTTTDNLGYYQFSNLEFGNYTVHVDIPGLNHDSTYTITIDATTPQFENLNFCADSVSVPSCQTPLGISNNINTSDEFIVYPNPTDGKVLILSSKFQIIKVEVYNVLGELIYQENMNRSRAKVDLSSKQKGIYFIKITDENKAIVNKKVIVQ